MFIDVRGNTQNLDLMLYVEEWTFTAVNGYITCFFLVMLVIMYSRLMFYTLHARVEGVDEADQVDA